MTGIRSIQRFCVGKKTLCKTRFTVSGVNWLELCEITDASKGENDNDSLFEDRNFSMHNAIIEKMVALNSQKDVDELMSCPDKKQQVLEWSSHLIEKIESGSLIHCARQLVNARDLAFLKGLHSILS